jgi:hypothetical protein
VNKSDLDIVATYGSEYILQLLFHVECSSATFCVTEWRAAVVTVSDAGGLARRREQGLTGA